MSNTWRLRPSKPFLQGVRASVCWGGKREAGGGKRAPAGTRLLSYLSLSIR